MLSLDSGLNLLLYSCFSRCFYKKGNSIWKKNEQPELCSPWTSTEALPDCLCVMCPLSYSTPSVVIVPSESEGRSDEVRGWYLTFLLWWFLIYQPPEILGLHKVQISEIIHCGFYLSELVSAPKKDLNKTGSFSWI